jgi:hypothetical protein
MNILYFSVHQILEFDEIIMLRQAGHFVFPLGSFFNSTPDQPFRPAPALGEKMERFKAKFHETGCVYEYGAPSKDIYISPEFINLFDVCIVMHDFEFIKTQLFEKVKTPVIWRSIGVSTEYHEPEANWFAERGGIIVRYSPREAASSNYAGHDAIIRFGKDVDIHPTWSGCRNNALLFSNDIRSRFPLELDFICEAMENRQFVLGGRGNEGIPGSVGILEYHQQIRLLSESRLYFYAAGSFIPYTLNFIEACLSGIPVVALNCNAIYSPEMCKFAEIPDLVENYGCGTLIESATHARDMIDYLTRDSEAATKLGQKGRRAAIELFSYGVIAPQWDQVLRLAQSGRGILA